MLRLATNVLVRTTRVEGCPPRALVLAALYTTERPPNDTPPAATVTGTIPRAPPQARLTGDEVVSDGLVQFARHGMEGGYQTKQFILFFPLGAGSVF